MIIITDYKLFLAEAEETIKKDSALNVARLEYFNQSQNGVTIAGVECSFIDTNKETIKYQKNIGHCTDQNFCIEDDVKELANAHLKKLAEKVKLRFKTIKKELTGMGFEVRGGSAQ